MTDWSLTNDQTHKQGFLGPAANSWCLLVNFAKAYI